MTEKRFTYKRRIEFDDTEITDHKTGEKFYGSYIATRKLNKLSEENEQLKQQLQQLKEDAPLLLAMYRWYPYAVTKDEHQAYNRLWDFVND